MDEPSVAGRKHPQPRLHLVIVVALVVSSTATAVVLLPEGPDANIGGGALFLLTGALTAIAGARAASSTLGSARRGRLDHVSRTLPLLLGATATALVVVQWTAISGAVIDQLILLAVATSSAIAATLLSPAAPR